MGDPIFSEVELLLLLLNIKKVIKASNELKSYFITQFSSFSKINPAQF